MDVNKADDNIRYVILEVVWEKARPNEDGTFQQKKRNYAMCDSDGVMRFKTYTSAKAYIDSLYADMKENEDSTLKEFEIEKIYSNYLQADVI